MKRGPRIAQKYLLIGLFPIILSAQYAPLERPREWTFQQATPAYSVEDPTKSLGEFQPGIQVEVLNDTEVPGMWHVKFKRYGHPDLHSLIAIPDLSKQDPSGFSKISGLIEDFPILQTFLESPDPWPDSANELFAKLAEYGTKAKIISGTQSQPTKIALDPEQAAFKSWDLQPLAVTINYVSEQRPLINIEFWSKGDAYRSTLDPGKTHRHLKENLTAIQKIFRTDLVDPGIDSMSSGINAVRLREETFLLPNDLRISLRYAQDEYVLLSFESLQKLKSAQPLPYESTSFRETIAGQVTKSKGGHRYIKNIPMIDQGEKGYCAAASLARVLQFYGYPVDMHAMAELAETEAQLTVYDMGGTHRQDLLRAIRRICNSTPFRMTELKKARPEEISGIIEQGIPILWFIPGHARLLIGIHPENNEIVFSDSWGPQFQYQTATWDYFANINQEMWYLEPRE